MEFKNSSIFGDLAKTVQLRFDAVSEQHKQLFDTTIFEKYLDWDNPQISFNFEELIGQYNITVAAPTIGMNSKEAILGSEGVETLRQQVLNHAITRPMTINDYRRVMAITDSRMLSDSAKNEQLIKLMWGDVESVVNSVNAKLDLIFLRALSNGGVCELDNITNPEGGVQGTINYNQPLSNIANVQYTWNDQNHDVVDCFGDIQAIIDAAQDKVIFEKILVSPAMLSYICRSRKVKQLVWGSERSGRLVSINDLNTFMQEGGFPIFEVVRRQVRIQNGINRKPYSPWNGDNMVFVPAGKLGVVKNAYANSELRPEPGVNYSNYGRIRVSQWGVGESQGSNGVEFTKAECLALPVITEFNGIYTLKTNTGNPVAPRRGRGGSTPSADEGGESGR